MANNWQINAIAGLDDTQSRNQLNSDIKKLEGNLNKLKLYAEIDKNQVTQLQHQLKNLQVQLNNVTVSDAVINGLVAKINAGLQNVNIGNINVGDIGNQTQRVNNNITQGFQQSTNAIESFRGSLSKVGKSTAEIDSIIDKVQKLNVQINSLRFSESTNGVMNVDVSGLDTLGNKVKITQTLTQDLQNQLWKVSNTTTSLVSTKELEKINNVFTDYTAKLAQFKSTNTNILSGLTQPLADFESKLAGLKNGTVSIDEVKNAFKLLGAEASKITEHFTGQLSKTDAAIRKLAQGNEIMDKLKASFKGLNNAPKEITKELTSVSKLLQNVKNIEAKEGRTANWSEAYRKWADEVDKLQAKLSVLQKQQANMTTPQIFKTSDLRNADIPYMTKVSNTIEKQMAEIQKMANAKGWQNFEVKGIEKADGQIKSLTLTVREADGALKQFQMQRAKLQGSGKAQTGLMQVGDVKVIETASQAQAKLAQQTDNANAKLQEQVNKIQLSMSTGGYESKVDSLIGKTQQWVDANGNARISTDNLQKAMNNLNTAYANITATGGNTVANQKALIEAERALDTEVKKVQSSVTSMNATMAKSNTVDSLRQKVQMFYDTNTKSHRTYGAQLRTIMSELASGAEVPITKLRQLSQEFIGIQNSARQAGKLGLSFFDTVKQGMKSFSYWTSSTFLVMKAIQEVRQVITNVKELDNAMMDLTMATGYNKNQVEELMDTYFKLGEELSATATDVAASADTWLRQGKSIAETNELIKDSMILSKISGLSAEESTKYLTSAMKGYKVATEDVLGVVDKLSAVDMASATDVGGLAEGMSEVAASADLAGVSMDKLLGYLAIVGETTQSGMSEVGTSFNAIFARMGNIKLARLKDYQNNGEDLSNVETVLRGEGIVLRDSVNEFRNFGEVLDEVAGRWTSFSEVSQRAIASAFAGTHHMNEFIILMENYGKAVEYSEISMESNGQAMEKFAAYEDTITAHTEKFKNAYQEMAKELLDSSVVKAFVDLGTGATKLVKELGLLGSIGLGASLFAGIKNVGINMLVAY